MQIIKSALSITFAISAVSAFSLTSRAVIVPGNITLASNDRFAASYLAPFAAEDAVDHPFELIDDHEDLIQDRSGAIVSLRKRGDDCTKYHKVARGENCYTLSLKYNVDMSSIYEWNSHINSKCTNLYPDKSYCVQKDGETILQNTCVDSYYVTSADSCITVAKAHGITLDQFYDMNPSVNRGACDNLLTGGTYCVKQVKKKIVQNVASLKTSTTSSPRKTKPSKAHTHKKKKYSKKRKPSRKNRKSTTTTTKKSTTTKKTTTKKTTTKKTTTKKTTTKKTTTTTTTKRRTTTATTKPRTTTRRTTTTTTTTTAKPTTTTTTTTQRATTTKKEEAPKPTGSSDKRKLLQKGADFTYYWIAHPEDYSHTGKDVTVRTCDGDSIGTVSEQYADALVMEGTGVLGNKVVNLGGCSCSNYKCFMEVDKKEDPYGLTAYGSPLRPYITIAANDIKKNTKIYVPSIDGWEIPGSSKKHNGCLLVDDRSWSFDSNHIDLYVYRKKNYNTLNSEHKISEVDIYEGGDCNLLNYT